MSHKWDAIGSLHNPLSIYSLGQLHFEHYTCMLFWDWPIDNGDDITIVAITYSAACWEFLEKSQWYRMLARPDEPIYMKIVFPEEHRSVCSTEKSPCTWSDQKSCYLIVFAPDFMEQVPCLNLAPSTDISLHCVACFCTLERNMPSYIIMLIDMLTIYCSECN